MNIHKNSIFTIAINIIFFVLLEIGFHYLWPHIKEDTIDSASELAFSLSNQYAWMQVALIASYLMFVALVRGQKDPWTKFFYYAISLSPALIVLLYLLIFKKTQALLIIFLIAIIFAFEFIKARRKGIDV